MAALHVQHSKQYSSPGTQQYFYYTVFRVQHRTMYYPLALCIRDTGTLAAACISGPGNDWTEWNAFLCHHIHHSQMVWCFGPTADYVQVSSSDVVPLQQFLWQRHLNHIHSFIHFIHVQSTWHSPVVQTYCEPASTFISQQLPSIHAGRQTVPRTSTNYTATAASLSKDLGCGTITCWTALDKFRKRLKTF